MKKTTMQVTVEARDLKKKVAAIEGVEMADLDLSLIKDYAKKKHSYLLKKD